MEWSHLFDRLVIPLLRMIFFMSLGLIIANLLEATHWVRFAAKLAAPLAKMGRLNEVCGASFSLAFFSPSASNGLLAEAYLSKKLSTKELVFANLFNSCPAFLIHLPTLFFMTYAFLGKHAFAYVGLTLAAAFLRTLMVLVGGYFLLPPLKNTSTPSRQEKDKTWREVAIQTINRFKKRIPKLLVFTIPTYCIVFAMQEFGWFEKVKGLLVNNNSALAFLSPEALGIVALQLAAESGIALSAAASLASSGALQYDQVILALLAGNILSSPVRAIRHRFPSYAGYFSPSAALLLVCVSQTYRIVSLVIVTAVYYWLVR